MKNTIKKWLNKFYENTRKYNQDEASEKPLLEKASTNLETKVKESLSFKMKELTPPKEHEKTLWLGRSDSEVNQKLPSSISSINLETGQLTEVYSTDMRIKTFKINKDVIEILESKGWDNKYKVLFDHKKGKEISRERVDHYYEDNIVDSLYDIKTNYFGNTAHFPNEGIPVMNQKTGNIKKITTPSISNKQYFMTENNLITYGASNNIYLIPREKLRGNKKHINEEDYKTMRLFKEFGGITERVRGGTIYMDENRLFIGYNAQENSDQKTFIEINLSQLESDADQLSHSSIGGAEVFEGIGFKNTGYIRTPKLLDPNRVAYVSTKNHHKDPELLKIVDLKTGFWEGALELDSKYDHRLDGN